jgi:hypothetical protein
MVQRGWSALEHGGDGGFFGSFCTETLRLNHDAPNCADEEEYLPE